MYVKHLAQYPDHGEYSSRQNDIPHSPNKCVYVCAHSYMNVYIFII